VRCHQILAFEPQGPLKPTHHGVIIKQVPQRVVIEEVVDRHQFRVRALIENAEHGPADSTESINGNSHCTPPTPSSVL
jgi:hypothetical protein